MTPIRIRSFLAALAPALALVAGCAPDDADVAEQLRASLRTMVAIGDSVRARHPQGPAESDSSRLVGRVLALYRQRRYHPLWTDAHEVTARGREGLRLLLGARAAGLDPADFGADSLVAAEHVANVADAHPAVDPSERLARFDFALTRALFSYGAALSIGRLPASTLDPDWRAAARRDTAWRVITRALVHGPLEPAFAGLEPVSDDYRALRSTLARYRAIAGAGGWGKVPAGASLRRGDSGRRVAALRRRLIASGDAAEAADSATFGRDLELAVQRAQARFGFLPTGVLDAVTVAALNLPVEARIGTIEMNLERWRWLPRSFEDRRLEVNIPGFLLAAWDSGQCVLKARVAVGKRGHETPVFTDAVAYLEFNPWWNVPQRIVVEELLPALRRDHEHLAKSNMQVLFTHAKEPVPISVDSVNWSLASTDSFPYLVRQLSGPLNPLGQIKFMCPNEYDVYLHDTPERGLFRALERARSHGCVRVQDPLALGTYFLEGTPLGTQDSLEARLASGEHQICRIAHSVPVHFLYRTAWVDSAGSPNFREDLYGLDRRLAAAFRSGVVDSFAINPEHDWKQDEPLAGKDAPKPAPARSRGLWRAPQR